jgi:HEPN domain-containing protein
MAEIRKDQLVKLSDAKLHDAKLLVDAGRTSNAYYLAGYAVELMLKAILSGQFKTDTLPDKTLLKDIFIHDLAKLVRLSHLEDDLKARKDIDADFEGYWQIVLDWNEASRYGEHEPDEANGLIEAIENPEHGVLPWLRSKL